MQETTTPARTGSPIDQVYEVIDFIEAASDEHLSWVLTAADKIARDRAERYEAEEAADWCPWRALIQRYPRVRLMWQLSRLNAFIAWQPDRARVVLNPSMLRRGREMAQALTHELIHDERGVGQWTDDERAIEEAEVRRLTELRMATWTGR